MSRGISPNSSQQPDAFRLRKKLPTKQPKRVGMWSIMKKFAGADLGKISLPVMLNEPITFLQRVCEPMDNIELLFEAVNEPDPTKRMSLVAAFVLASYASSDERMWKPFNPLLGETYEVMRRSFRVIAEQVSHHPPITAFHAEAPNVIFQGTIAPKFKLNGQSIEIANTGQLSITLTNLGETYSWSIDGIMTRVNNLMFGKMWMENIGKIAVKNQSNGYKAALVFLPNNAKKNTLNRAEGFIKDDRNHKQMFIYGKYSRFVKVVDMDTYRTYAFANANQFDGRIMSYFNVPPRPAKDAAMVEKTRQPRTKEMHHPIHIPNSKWLWVHNKLPPYREIYYNFSYFAFTLNELEPYMMIPGVLCPTDSRYRPDVRAYENGRVDEADLLKQKLESAQRHRAKMAKGPWKPRWFALEVNPQTGNEVWVYKGNYWSRKYPEDEILSHLFDVT